VRARETSSDRVVLFGTTSPFSAAVFRLLVEAGIRPSGAATFGPKPAAWALPVAVPGLPDTLTSLAAAAGVPVRYVTGPDDPALHRWLADLAPAFILVACFPHRLSEALCALATRDCLNLHPSLLPRYRGPTPLFWQLRNGEADTGVTLHRVRPRLDAGEIVLQARLALPDGIDAPEAARRLAEQGGRLFVEALALYAAHGEPPTRAQDEAASSRYGPPGADDFRVHAEWSARRVFNFMRATRDWGQPYPIWVGGRDYPLLEALAYEPETRPGRTAARDGDRVHIQCSPGLLHARLVAGRGTG